MRGFSCIINLYDWAYVQTVCEGKWNGMQRLNDLRAKGLRFGAVHGTTWFYAALVLFVVLTSFFSSNIQSSFPAFSRAMRLGLCGVTGAMFAAKLYLFTSLTARQFAGVSVLLAFTLLLSVRGGDLWFFTTALLLAAGRGADPRVCLKLFFCTAAACILLTQLLHLAGLIPFGFPNERALDFGYGHYNGFAGRLFGLYTAALLLLFDRLKPWGWALLACVPAAVLLLTTSRGGTAACAAVYLALLACRLAPGLFLSRALRGLLMAYDVGVWVFSLAGMVLFDETSAFWRAADRLDNLRFSFGHAAFAQSGVSLLGGTPVDTGSLSAVDNAYMAAVLNKGVLGALLLFIAFTALLWLLCRQKNMPAALALCAVLLHGMTENRFVEISSDPVILYMLLLWPGPGPAADTGAKEV